MMENLGFRDGERILRPAFRQSRLSFMFDPQRLLVLFCLGEKNSGLSGIQQVTSAEAQRPARVEPGGSAGDDFKGGFGMNHGLWEVVLGSVLTLAVGLAPAAAQDDGDAGDGAKEKVVSVVPRCPLTNEPVNLAVSVATDEGPLFFCCKGCISKYQADPTKYATKVAAQRKALASRDRVQVTCPVSREPVDQKVFVESNGRQVYFCCKGCIGKYQQDPDKYRSALANSYTYQTQCPVMDEEIDPKVLTTTATGQNIYFCCKGCDKKFVKDPSKYAPHLVAQGYTLNPADMKQAKKVVKAHEGDDHDHDHDH